MSDESEGSDIDTLESFQNIDGLEEPISLINPDQSESGFWTLEGESTGQSFMNPPISGGGDVPAAVSKEPYVVADPAFGDAPLAVTLQVLGIDQTAFWLWELDRDGDGYSDIGGQGAPFVQMIYDRPGIYAPTFTFYDDNNRIIAQARGLLTVTGQGLAPAEDDALLPAEPINATPSEGYAPLQVILDARSIAPPDYYTWSLDQYSGGILSYPGGEPIAQVIYENPGAFNATIVFYDSTLQEISRGRVTIIVHNTSYPTESEEEHGSDSGTQSQALTALPSGSGIIRGGDASGQGRPKVNLGDGSWKAPDELITEDLRPELYVFPERGSAPLTVRFDASRTFSRYGVYSYNYDIAWGPDNAPDDGYYLSSSPDPRWTHTFEEYGSYLVIMDVEDNRGERSRTTRVIFVLDTGLAPAARITANRTSGYSPMTVAFEVEPAAEQEGYEAAYAYWDFDLSTIGPMEGGELAAYKNIVHTYGMPGDYAAGSMLADSENNFGTMVRMAIHVAAPNESSPSSSGSSLQGQVMPILHVAANRTSGPAPLSVEFDASSSYLSDGQGALQEGKILGASFDPDGGGPAPRNDILGLRWTYLYERPGVYEAEVMAIDLERRRSMPQVIRIEVGEAAVG